MKPFIGIVDKYGRQRLISVNAISDVCCWCDVVTITMTNGEYFETNEDFENIQAIWLNCYK